MSSPDITTKRCKKCNVEYPATAEFWHKNHSSGLHSICKQCKNEYGKAWREANQDQVKATRRSYCARTGQATSIRNHSYRSCHQEELREYQLHRRHIRKEDTKLYHQRRRARRIGLPDAFSISEWRNCLEWWNFRCAYCGHQEGLLPGMKLCADHYIPIANVDVCPGTVRTNIVPACGVCNLSKSDSCAHDWIVRRFGQRKAKQIESRITGYFEACK